MKKKLFAISAGLLLALTIIVPTMTSAKAGSVLDSTIAQGVYVGRVDVSGLTEQQARATLEEYVESMMNTTYTLQGPSGSISMTGADMGITLDAEAAAAKAMTVAHSGNLVNRFVEKKNLEKTNVVVDMDLVIDKQAIANYIYNKQDKLNNEAVDATLKRENGAFVYVEGSTGTEVDIVPSVLSINDYLLNTWNAGEDTIDLVVTEVQPRGSRDELAQVTDLLGSYSTIYPVTNPGRVLNVQNGTAKVNGTILYPGDEFSMYATCSPFTEANGYGTAGAYQDGKVIESVGGGICQVATTLYNAIIRAEVDVTMRYNHSMTVSYVSPSEDAAIAGTYKDLRFVNNYDFPIYIEGYCSGNKMTFNVYGKETRPANRKVNFVSEIVAQGEPTIQFNLSGDVPLGYCNVEQGAFLATSARLWKIVTVDGVEQSREQFNSSKYRASPRTITVGIAGANADQLAALNGAIATGDEGTVRATIVGLTSGQ